MNTFNTEQLADVKRQLDNGVVLPNHVVRQLIHEGEYFRNQIGSPPEGSHPGEAFPRDATWHKERANWTEEVGRLRTTVSRLEDDNKAFRTLLARIRMWDHMDAAGDGSYWKKVIDEALREVLIVEFYDPHPGLAGCTEPIPEPVRLVANKLVGKRMTVLEAMNAIRRVASEGYDVDDHGDFIGLRGGPEVDAKLNLRQLNWRVIRYRSIRNMV